MKKLSIVADENMAGVVQSFGEFGSVRLLNGRAICADDLLEADVLLVRSVTRVNEALLANSSVKFVGTATSGFDHIDRDYLRLRGISFAHAPGSNANSVVEYVLSAIAMTDDKLEQLFNGAVVGVIGYGNIGKLLASRLTALNIAFKVYDPWLDQAKIPAAAALEDVLACDVVTLHAELTHALPWPSFHLLGEEQLPLLRHNALLINAGRGPVIDGAALENYMGENPELTVVSDVWEGEPVVSVTLLSKVHVGSAHIAGYSLDGKLLATKMLRDALSCHLGKTTLEAEVKDNSTAPRIQLQNRSRGANLLRDLLLHNYDIALDDRLLREAVLGQASDIAAAAFDRLRKQYRIRREVFGSEVEVEALQRDDVFILEAMSCTLVKPAKSGRVQ
jgi:erythronate-4-phosphate dehydrogenase